MNRGRYKRTWESTLQKRWRCDTVQEIEWSVAKKMVVVLSLSIQTISYVLGRKRGEERKRGGGWKSGMTA